MEPLEELRCLRPFALHLDMKPWALINLENIRKKRKITSELLQYANEYGVA